MSIQRKKDKEAVDMLATPMQKAIIIDKRKTNEFVEAMKKTVPTKKYWEDCKKSASSLDMERLNRLYDSK